MTLLALAVPLACGFLLVRLLLPARRFLWLSLSLGAGLGMGIASCLFFLALMMGLPVVVLAAVEAAGLGGLVVAWKRLARPPEEAGEDRGNRVVAVGFALSLALALAATVWRLSSAPHGHWDAWAIWNLRARFLARPGQWRDAFHSLLVAHHPDYPLLIPALIARCWRYAGESAAAPAMVSVLFSLATLGVLVSGIALLRGKTAGQMAGLVLAATLFFWKETAAEYADLPVGFFLLSAVALLGLAGAFAAERRNLLLLAGFAAGMGAWTKNEGLLMLLAVGLGWLVATRKLSEVVPLLIGAAPPGAVVALFKLTLAPPNDLVARNDPASALQRLSQWTRLAEVAAALARELVRFGDFALNPLLLLASCALLLGWEWRHRAGLVTGALALGLTLGGYLLALLLSPAALGWQLDTALSRLLLQLWPCAVLTCFLGLKPLAVAAPPAPVKKIRRK